MIFIKVYFWGRKCIILHIVLSVRLNEARFLVKQRFVIITDRPDPQRKKNRINETKNTYKNIFPYEINRKAKRPDTWRQDI